MIELMCFLQQAYKERGEGKPLKKASWSAIMFPLSRLYKRITHSSPVLSWTFSVWVSRSSNKTKWWQLLWKASATKVCTGSACQDEEETSEKIVCNRMNLIFAWDWIVTKMKDTFFVIKWSALYMHRHIKYKPYCNNVFISNYNYTTWLWKWKPIP